MTPNRISEYTMLQVLFLGIMPRGKESDFLLSRGIRPNPVAKVCEYIIEGLQKAPNIAQIHMVSSIRIKPFPWNKIIRVDNDKDSLGNCATYESVGFYNFPVFGFITRELGIIREVCKWAKSNKNKELMIIVYSMNSSFLQAAVQAKKIAPHAKISLIVADLPLFMDMRGTFKRVLKKVDWIRISHLLKYVDTYALYTKYMASYLKLSKDKWILFEGLIGNDRISNSCISNENREDTCIYAGNLDRRYGIDKLIKAFSQLENLVNTQLHIYGTGDIKDLQSQIKNFPNIKYKGIVDADSMFIIMKSSKLLINPRPSNLGLAKYSCPSKTLEYLASGTPVLTTKLPGIPDEYFDYVFCFEDETIEGMRDKIRSILLMPDEKRNSMGEAGLQFINRHKNSKCQIARLINSIYYNKDIQQCDIGYTEGNNAN